MNLNIEDPTLAKLVEGLGQEIGELMTANVFLAQIVEKAQLDNQSMHNLLALRDETIKNMNTKLSEQSQLIVELKNKIDPNYRNKKKKVKFPVINLDKVD